MTEAIFLLISFFLALFLIVAIVIVGAFSTHWPGRVFHYLMLLITSVSVVVVLLSERVLRIEGDALSISSEADIGGTILAKFLLVIIVGCSVSICIAWPFVSQKSKIFFSRFESQGSAAPNDVVISFMVYYLAFSILPLFFGEKFYFHVSLIYPFFVILALFLWFRLSNIDPVIISKQCLSLFVFGSLGSAIFMPEFSMQPGYPSLIPGFDIRLWGVTPHANTLGSAAAALLLLEAAEPSTRRWLRNSVLVVATLILVMSQSKTSILGLLLGLLILITWRFAISLKRKDSGWIKSRRLDASAIVAIVTILIAVIGIGVVLLDSSPTEMLRNTFDTRAVEGLKSASGRTDIWNAAIVGGLENPLFGQGARYWDQETADRFGLSGSVNAHNLFMQAFSRSGFVGLTALLVFLFYLFRCSVRASKQTRGGSIAFTVLFLTRGIFEVTISPNSILGAEFIAMMAFFLYLIDRGGAIKEIRESKE